LWIEAAGLKRRGEHLFDGSMEAFATNSSKKSAGQNTSFKSRKVWVGDSAAYMDGIARLV
jgi:hypothetical protein